MFFSTLASVTLLDIFNKTLGHFKSCLWCQNQVFLTRSWDISNCVCGSKSRCCWAKTWSFSNPNKVVPKPNQSISTDCSQLSTVVCSHGAKQPIEAWWYMSWWWHLCVFFKVFPWCHPVNINVYLLIVYNHMDAFIICCDWDTNPSCILESDKVKFFVLNYIST